MPEARERKNEARERKNSDKIKSGNGAKKSPVKNDVRRQMTVKLQREMIERRRNRDTSGSKDTAPEVQATEQVEEKVYTTVESIREHTNNAVSKSIARHRRKLQKEKGHKDQNRDEIPVTDAEAAHPSPPAQEDIPQQAVGDARTQRTETRQERPTPKTRPVSDRVRGKDAPAPTGKDRPIMPTSSPGEQMRRTMIKEKRARSKKPQSKLDTPVVQQTHAPFHEREQPTIPPPAPKEKIRQTMIQEKQTQRKQSKEIRQKPGMPKESQISAPLPERHVPKERQLFERIRKKDEPKEQRTSAPLHERTAPKEQQTPAPFRGKDAPKSQQTPAPFFRRAKPYDTRTERAAAPPNPQERMRQKAIADAQIKQVKQGKDYSAGTVPHLESPPASKRVVVNTPVSPDIQSINPIKERSRRSFAPKERPSGGSFVPKTRKAAAASSTAKTAPPAIERKEKARPLERMRQRIRRNAQRKMLQKSSQNSKEAANLSRRLIAAMTRATSSAASSLAGLVGGSALIPLFCLIILVAAVLASPFGILFANEPTTDAVPLNVAVGNLNMELSNTLESLQSGDYDSIDIQGQGPDWREVVAVFAVKTAGADNGVDVASLTQDRINRLKAVFWDMCTVTSELETIDHPDSNPSDDTDDSWTERILHIRITAKTADDMRTEYAFTDFQNQALTELLAELATMDILLTDLSAIEETARDLLQGLPADLSPERRAVIETACKLVGKVNYFWGGKSLVLGWDSRWGTIQKVWAAGSPSTGTYRPFGMDCSGFVDWVFYNMSGGSYVIGHGGGAHMQHTYCTPITWSQARPGDLVFYPEDTHVGIVGGWDESGNILVIHCASGKNNVVITGKAGFTSIGRPQYYGD